MCESCRVWSSDPVCSKKSSIEHKHKQKLLKSKSTIKKATFNVRTLNRIGQLPDLTAYAKDHNIDTECIQEHIYTKYHDTGNGWMVVFHLLGKTLSTSS